VELEQAGVDIMERKILLRNWWLLFRASIIGREWEYQFL
jgi:hypothetical protein